MDNTYEINQRVSKTIKHSGWKGIPMGWDFLSYGNDDTYMPGSDKKM